MYCYRVNISKVGRSPADITTGYNSAPGTYEGTSFCVQIRSGVLSVLSQMRRNLVSCTWFICRWLEDVKVAALFATAPYGLSDD